MGKNSKSLFLFSFPCSDIKLRKTDKFDSQSHGNGQIRSPIPKRI